MCIRKCAVQRKCEIRPPSRQPTQANKKIDVSLWLSCLFFVASFFLLTNKPSMKWSSDEWGERALGAKKFSVQPFCRKITGHFITCLQHLVSIEQELTSFIDHLYLELHDLWDHQTASFPFAEKVARCFIDGTCRYQKRSHGIFALTNRLWGDSDRNPKGFVVSGIDSLNSDGFFTSKWITLKLRNFFKSKPPSQTPKPAKALPRLGNAPVQRSFFTFNGGQGWLLRKALFLQLQIRWHLYSLALP